MKNIVKKLLDMSGWFCHNDSERLRNEYAKEAADEIKFLRQRIKELERILYSSTSK